jgi:hypothetical protein
VYWSHPNEYAGFRLWSALAARDGEANLYRERWALTRRTGDWWLQHNDPAAARRTALSLGGFAMPGLDEQHSFGQIYPLEEVQRAEGWMGADAAKTAQWYARAANRLVHAQVRVPERWPSNLDAELSLLLAAVAVLAWMRGSRRRKLA